VIPVLVPLALLANGIAAGIMLGNAIGPAAFAARLDYGSYVALIKFMWPRYDPLVPILNVVALAGDVAVVLIERRWAVTVWFGPAAVALVVLVVISVAKNVPINRYVTRLDPERPPPEWPASDPRAEWTVWNQIRVLLILVALVAGLVGAGTLLHRP
jgi:hypothetical protein